MSHPTDRELTAFLDASPDADRAIRNVRVVRHLLAGCDVCKSRLERLKTKPFSPPAQSAERPRAPSAHTYEQAFSNVARTLETFLGAGFPVNEPPEMLLAELAPAASKLGSEHQRMLPALVKWLVERSHAVRYGDPADMLRWAHWAQLAAETCAALEIRGPRRLADLQACAWGQLGNALRVNGRLEEAAEALTTAQRHGRDGTGDLLLRAKLCEQTASLHIFERRFADAQEATAEASSIYEEVGERQGLARALVVQAIGLAYAGQLDEAVHVLHRAFPMIDGDEDPHLLHAARHNLALCHLDLGQPELALSIHDSRRCPADPLILLRAQWEEGRLMRELGHFDLAEAALRQVRTGFVRRGLAYEGAVISVELANLYAKVGRPRALQQLVAETLPIFRALRIGRETLAALVQLQQAGRWH